MFKPNSLQVLTDTFSAYVVHCAVIGGNIQLLRYVATICHARLIVFAALQLTILRWLVDENMCPIKSVRISGKSKDAAGKYTPIVTSKGRALLGIAMEQSNIQMVRYLVVEKGISLSTGTCGFCLC
jgi:hypothetical protein